jgi:RNA polymerase sigma-70 factor, ECF subfamily
MYPPIAPVENCGVSSNFKICAPTVSGSASPERRPEFDGLLYHLLPRLRRMALRWLRNPDDAEDAVQDAMLSALRHLDQFDGRSQMSTWLTAILRNAVLMQIRRRPRSQMASLSENTEGGKSAVLETLADPRPTPDQILENSQLCQLVRRLRNTLPRHQQAVLKLRIQGDSVKEVAKALDIPEGTVKAQLARGRASLKERLQAAIAMPCTAKLRCTAKTKSKASCSRRRTKHEYEPELPAMLVLPDRAVYELSSGV